MNIPESLSGKRILHVLDASLPALAGYSIRAKYIVKFQKQMGLAPIVITSPLFEKGGREDEVIDSIKYYRTFRKPGPMAKNLMRIPFLSQLMVINSFRKQIRDIALRNKIDIIHAHSPSLCGIPALKAAEDLKLPFAYEVRAFWEDAAVDRKRFSEKSLKYRISQFMEQQLFDDADIVIPICEGLKKEIYERSQKDNLYIVKNGVDTDQFIPLKADQSLVKKLSLEDEIIVGFIGSFFTFEGLDDLINSAPRVLEKQTNVTFLIVGGGVEEENMMKLSKDLGLLGAKIIFTGRVPHEQVNNYYSICDILVYPRKSLRITELVTPLKPLEAMSMEKTVLASDVGGLRELIDDNETGLLYEAENIDDLTSKILYLAGDKMKRESLGKRARQRMIEKRDWSEIAKTYISIYEKMLTL